MYSMTGYGKGTVIRENRELTVEIKSVNHRYLDLNVKMPKVLAPFEDGLRKQLQQGLTRGRLDVFLTYLDKREQEKTVNVDMGLAKAYVSAKNELLKELQLPDDLTVTSIMRFDGVIKSLNAEEDEEFMSKLVFDATEIAIDSLNEMRRIEGEKLKADILVRVAALKEMLVKVRKIAPKVAESYRIKLKTRITEVLSGVEIDEAKLVNEVAFFADKSNIDEEITRLASHFDGAEKLLSDKAAVGRKLDFLIQEFNREANTICSKSNDVELTNVALDMKAEIEKIREQIQNIE